MKYILIALCIASANALAAGGKIDIGMVEKKEAQKAATVAIELAEAEQSADTLLDDIAALKNQDASPALKAILVRIATLTSTGLSASKTANTKKEKKEKKVKGEDK